LLKTRTQPRTFQIANDASELQPIAEKAPTESDASIDWSVPQAKKPAVNKGYFNVQDDIE